MIEHILFILFISMLVGSLVVGGWLVIYSRQINDLKVWFAAMYMEAVSLIVLLHFFMRKGIDF